MDGLTVVPAPPLGPAGEWRFVVAAVPAGAIAGAAAVAFARVVGVLRALGLGESLPLIAAPAVGALLCVVLVRWVPDAGGGGIPQARQAFASGVPVRGRVAIVKAVAAGAMLGSGGSGGAEGPTVHIAASLGSVCARVLGVPFRPVAAAAVAGGMAASFGAPLAGVALAAEVLLTELTRASVVAVAAGALAGAAVQEVLPGEPLRVSGLAAAGVPYGALLAALAGVALAEVLYAAARLPGWARVLSAPALCLLVFFVPDVAGIGVAGGVVWLAAAKIAATGLTVGAGGVVGTIGPSLFVGATIGSTLPMPGGAAAGMAACLAAASRAPATAIVLAVEVSGVGLLPQVLLAGAIGWAVGSLTRHGVFDP